MREQNSNNKVLVGIIFVLVAIIIGGGAYFLFFQKKDSGSSEKKDESSISTPAVADITNDTNAETSKKDTAVGKLDCVKDQKEGADYCKIDSANILNARSGITYTLTELTKDDSLASDFEKLAKITINKDDAKKAEIRFDEKVVEQYYGEKGLNYKIFVTFSREIVSTKIAGFGQAVGDEYVFFIMKDGTVDMLRVYSMLKDKKYDPRVISGVKDVTTILGGSSYSEIGGGHTNFAVRSDGKAYDLQTMLPSWGVE